MHTHRHNLPQLNADLFLTYTGMETDLLFTQNVDLPGFATFPLLETEEGTAHLSRYARDLIAIGKEHGVGVILESATWVANRDRGAAIGYSPEQLAELNKKAIGHLCDMRDEYGDLPTVISANVGPRSDAYASSEQMNAEEAEAYHVEQIAVLAQTDVDMISGYTIGYAAEATGIVRAAKSFGIPVVVAFTVEIDGCLPTGAALETAIKEVDDGTDGYASYFMINCAHPDHFANALVDGPRMRRMKGIVANASRCSHAELDNAEVLDAGNPIELGGQLANLRQRFPHITVLGGCCGTDMRHMQSIVTNLGYGAV
ncbi:MAG: homocysteine S-methyltransferase family protein [Paracoccaceae bacterium]|uniref:homocysteine S-methyltransferase family protein n=1 Tax=Yoonia sp. TaxID=2212373 RepID=UPI00328A037A